MNWRALICKLSGVHDRWMTDYPPGPVRWICTRCGVSEVRMPVPEPVHGAVGGPDLDPFCGLCRRWISSPLSIEDPLLTHLRLVHGVTATTPRTEV